MGRTRTDEFRKDAVRTALTSGLTLTCAPRTLNRPLFAGGSKVSMDGAYGKK